VEPGLGPGREDDCVGVFCVDVSDEVDAGSDFTVAVDATVVEVVADVDCVFDEVCGSFLISVLAPELEAAVVSAARIASATMSFFLLISEDPEAAELGTCDEEEEEAAAAAAATTDTVPI
jgi:hypothetical protein